MKLFLDTSTDKIMFGIINEENKVVAFKKINANRDMVKKTNDELKTFLLENKVKNDEIKQIYLTIGPGSFTGVKVSFLIAKTYKIFNEKIELMVIDTLTLGKRKKVKPVVKISKNNFFYQKKLFLKETFKLVKEDPKFKNQEINFENFGAKDLEKNLSKFKLQNSNDIELIYMN